MVALTDTDKIVSVDSQVTFDRHEARLGDGYRRLAESGINNVRESYTITYGQLSHADAKTVLDWFKARKGTEVIDWTPPGESSSRKWTVESVTQSNENPNTKTITASLEEWFGP